ncbi:MAG: diaminopimelate decarboxylase [Gaiellales bacterium]|nr:diaminopimelate decarboxylase [Gaiellales bacterium]
MAAVQIDECLSIAAGRLRIEGCDAPELAERFGTPLSVVSEDHLRRNARRFTAALASAWPEGPSRALPSIKANFTLALRCALTQEGLGCDVFGPAELHAALAGGVPPRLISVNGTGKTRALLERAIAVGARVTLDSTREIELVRAVARELGRRAQVRFRMRPRYLELQQPSDFSESSVYETAQEYKPGIPTDELIAAGREAVAAPELEVLGLMSHLGRHRSDAETWRAYAASAGETVAELVSAWEGWQPAELDLGGGYAAPRDPNTWEHGGDISERRTPPIETVVAALAEGLRAGIAGRVPLAGVTLELEPGRSLHADTGIHLTRVVNLKEQREPLAWRWVETDTTEMFLLDLLVEHCRFPVVAASRMSEPPGEPVDVVGCSCGFDTLARQVRLPAVALGDTLAFLDTGAYEDGCAANFNALPRPAVVLVSGSGAEIVRRAETIEDVFARDVVPERLLP